MKVIQYSRLNAKNKTRFDQATEHYEVKPALAHHSTVCTRSTKMIRSMVTVVDPSTELQLVVGGKIRVTQVALDK